MAEDPFHSDEEDENHENRELKNFFQENGQFLKQYPLYKIPNQLKREAGATYAKSLDIYEWRGVLENLGVDQTTIDEFEYEAKNTGVTPICLALNKKVTSHTSLGDFINIVCKGEKFRLLRCFKPFVKELLFKIYDLNEEGLNSAPHPSAPNFSSFEVTSSLVDFSGFEGNYSTQHDSVHQSVPRQEIQAKDVNDHNTTLECFQNAEAISSFVNNKQLSSISNFRKNQSVDKSISVFIMHCMLDKKYAKKLAECLREKNYKVLTSAKIFPRLRMNHTLIMTEIDKRADFIIIVVSESFMRQINSTGYNITEGRNIEWEANAFLYDRLLNEFVRRNNRNLRVIPVIYSLEARKLENNDRILSFSFYLPKKELKDDQLLESKLLRFIQHS